MNLLIVKKDVEALLQKSEKCRESDSRLVACIWNKYIGVDMNTLSAFEFMQRLSHEQLPNYESITRVARKLKEKNPLYRGKNYLKRLEEQEEVKKQLEKI